MKTLSIKEPFASLIINGYKKYEFRTYKTNYQGKLLIHASSKFNKNVLAKYKSLNINYRPGYIIGEVNIKKCIPLTEEFINELKKENSLIYQDINKDCYAWLLTNIKKYDKPIKAKGRLSLWEYFFPDEIMNIMDNIRYGYLDKNLTIHLNFDKFRENYILASPKEVLKYNVGICWDQVELERYLFKGYDIKTYFIVYLDGVNPTHTFLEYISDNKYYWFEHAWEDYKSIHEYKEESFLLEDIKNKFIKSNLDDNYDKGKLKIYIYKKPKYHISIKEFFENCTKEEV